MAINVVMGKPGVGKSTYLCLLAKDYLKKGVKVYSNFPIVGCYKLDVDRDIMQYNLSDAVLLIDEAGRCFNNRSSMKTFTQKYYDFFTLHRHYNLDIYLSIQFWSKLDIVIRQLIQNILVVQPTIFNKWFLKIKTVGISICIPERTDELTEVHFWRSFLQGGIKYYRRKPAFSMFDSYETEFLPEKEFKLW